MTKKSLDQALLLHLMTNLSSQYLIKLSSYTRVAKTAIKAIINHQDNQEITLPNNQIVTARELCDQLNLWEFVNNVEHYTIDNPGCLPTLGLSQLFNLIFYILALKTVDLILPNLTVINITTTILIGLVLGIINLTISLFFGVNLINIYLKILTKFLDLNRNKPKYNFSLILPYILSFCSLISIFLIDSSILLIAQARHLIILVNNSREEIFIVVFFFLLIHYNYNKLFTPSLNFVYMNYGQSLIYFLLQLLLLAYIPFILIKSQDFLNFFKIDSFFTACLIVIIVISCYHGFQVIWQLIFKIIGWEKLQKVSFNSSIFQFLVISLSLILLLLPLFVLNPLFLTLAKTLLQGFMIEGYPNLVLLSLIIIIAKLPFDFLSNKIETDLKKFINPNLIDETN
jgi:hypothetical protein